MFSTEHDTELEDIVAQVALDLGGDIGSVTRPTSTMLEHNTPSEGTWAVIRAQEWDSFQPTSHFICDLCASSFHLPHKLGYAGQSPREWHKPLCFCDSCGKWTQTYVLWRPSAHTQAT